MQLNVTQSEYDTHNKRTLLLVLSSVSTINSKINILIGTSSF